MMLLLYILTVTRVIANGAADKTFEKLHIGDQCNITNTYFGQCTLFQQCNTSFKEKTCFPICGFLGFEPIICCPIFNSRTNTLPGYQSGTTSGNTSGDTNVNVNNITSSNTSNNKSGKPNDNSNVNTSGATSSSISGNTHSNTSGDLNGNTSNNTSGATSSNTSDFTSRNTNGNLNGNTSGNTNGDTSLNASIKSSALIKVNPCNTVNETCTLYSECKTVANLFWKGVAPTICGYQRNEHLICCPSNAQKQYYYPHNCNSTEVCKYYSQCNTVKHELLSYKNPVVTCGYRKESLICCPIRNNEKYSSTANPNFCKHIEENCKLHSECDTINNVLSQNISLTTCGYQGHEKLICCPVRKSEVFCFKNYLHPSPEYVHSREFNYTSSIQPSYGGSNSLAGEFPHMAILGYGTKENLKWGCGGSLISTRHVLTAAHCLWSRELGDVKFVRLGDLNLAITTDLADPQDFTVVNKIRHPNYRPPSKYHDIAILELDRDYKQSDYVKPACLQNIMEIQGTKFKATGWGRLEFDGEMADHLQVVILNNIDNAQCNNDYKSEDKSKLQMGIMQDSQICAGNETADTCPGDSGGPLQIRFATRMCWLVCGVTSFGKPCGISKSAGVYTRVSNYIDWIESIVWP